MNKLMLAAVAVLLAACSSGGGSNGSAGTPGASTATAGTSVQVMDFKITPNPLSVAAGNVTFNVTNGGPTVHNVTIRDASGKVLFASRDLRAGESQSISGPLAAGSYVMFCSLPGHESLGTKGTLTVSAP